MKTERLLNMIFRVFVVVKTAFLLLILPIMSYATEKPEYIQLPYWGEQGLLIDERVGLPVSGAIVNLSWRLQKDDTNAMRLTGRKPRLYVLQVLSNNSGIFTIGGDNNSFRIPQGWELADNELVVTVFHPRYKVATITDYDEAVMSFPVMSEADEKQSRRGIVFRMERNTTGSFQSEKSEEIPLPRQWKNAIEEEVMNFSWRGREFALSSQLPLINSLRAMCMQTHDQACPDQNAYLMRFLNEYPQVVQRQDMTRQKRTSKPSPPSFSVTVMPKSMK